MNMEMLSKWPAMKVNYLIVLLAITLFPSSPVRGEQTTNNEPTFIRSVNLVDVRGGRVTPEMDVLVADGRIQQIGHKLPRPKGARVVDGTKRFLVPGLWDMHVHTAGLSANPEWSRDTLLPLLVC